MTLQIKYCNYYECLVTSRHCTDHKQDARFVSSTALNKLPAQMCYYQQYERTTLLVPMTLNAREQ